LGYLEGVSRFDPSAPEYSWYAHVVELIVFPKIATFDEEKLNTILDNLTIATPYVKVSFSSMNKGLKLGYLTYEETVGIRSSLIKTILVTNDWKLSINPK